MTVHVVLLAGAIAILSPLMVAAQVPDPVDLTRATRLNPSLGARIGGSDPREPHTFSRIAHGAMLRNGEVILADAATKEVRVFGSDGVFLRRFGREGEGPGEFSFVEGLAALPDGRVLVFDGSRRQLSIFDSEGRHISTHRVGGSGSFVGAFPDGSIALRSGGGAASMLSRAPGPFRDSISFSIYAPPYSSAGRTVGVLQGADRLLRVMGSARNVASKLFEPAVVAAVHADELIVAFTGTANLSRIASDGSARPHWQLRTRRRPVSNGHIRDERDRRIREFEAATSRSGSNPLPFGGPPPETQRLRREAVENLESYTTFPEFRSILAGVDGVLWLEDYPLPGSDRVRWYRLENGVANAWVELSETAQVIAVAQDSFILLERDDFGLETAVIVRLQ